MLTVDGRTLEGALKLVAAEREKVRDTMEFGQPHVVPDYATYRQHVGYLSGLAFLETAIAEAREKAEQEAGLRPKAA